MAQFDLSSLFQQAQALQEKLKEAQEQLALRTVESDSGGGMVRSPKPLRDRAVGEILAEPAVGPVANK